MAEGEAAVHFIDVGQGDSELIVSGDTVILIDSGEYVESSRVYSYIDSLGIKEIDYIIATHPHSDHIGGLYRIVEKFNVKNVIMPDIKDELIPLTSSYINLIEAIEKYNVKLKIMESGESIDFGADGKLDIIAPVKDYDDLNNYSIVAKFTHKQNSFLFTGDIENLAEYDIVESGADLSADVLKVAHHGSSTSSLKVFVQAVSPDYAAIEVGRDNDYHHPHTETISLLKKLGVTIYRTDTHGDITFISDGASLRVVTDKG